jgi:ElaB/YqjD/DUF883 family membrane-anchored ribosome-binding protein
MDAREYARKEYEILQKKYELPPFEKVEDELGIYIEKPPAVQEILRQLSRYVDILLNHLQSVIEPSRYDDFIEHGFYTETERKEIEKEYKDLMSLLHKILSGGFSKEKEKCQIMKEAFEKYVNEIKPRTRRYFADQSEKWVKKEKKETKVTSHYG